MCPDGSDPIERLVPGDSVPEPIADKPAELTGEISALPPEEASKVAAEIRAVAETRGVDADVAELVELQKTGPLPIARDDDLVHEGRHLAALDELDREVDLARAFGRRGDRVAALGPVAVVGGEPYVDVLAGAVTRPVRHVEDQGVHPLGFGDDRGDPHGPPGQSPVARSR